MNTWWIMIIGGLFTFLTRLSFIAIFSRKAMPPIVQRALRYVPPAVLSTIALQGLLFPQGHLDISLSNPRWMAGLIAGLVAWRTRNALLTIIAGMLIMVLFQLFLK
jgi:branched-subunit amino acid transport protein